MRRRALLALAVIPAAAEILAPAPDSVVAPGKLRIVARVEGKAELRLDGKPVVAESPAPGVLTSEAVVGAGRHEILLLSGQKQEKVAVHAGAGPPPGWKPFRPHPPAAACDTCHAVKDGQWAFQRISLMGLCFNCHQRDSFQPRHTHQPGVLADCQMCHAPHGSTAPVHLKMEKETACKLCHN